MELHTYCEDNLRSEKTKKRELINSAGMCVIQ